jgi:hypothetical protein
VRACFFEEIGVQVLCITVVWKPVLSGLTVDSNINIPVIHLFLSADYEGDLS